MVFLMSRTKTRGLLETTLAKAGGSGTPASRMQLRRSCISDGDESRAWGTAVKMAPRVVGVRFGQR